MEKTLFWNGMSTLAFTFKALSSFHTTVEYITSSLHVCTRFDQFKVKVDWLGFPRTTAYQRVKSHH